MYHSHWSVAEAHGRRSRIKVGLKTEVDGQTILIEKTDAGPVITELDDTVKFHLPDEEVDVPGGLQTALEIAYRAQKEFKRIVEPFVSGLSKNIGP